MWSLSSLFYNKFASYGAGMLIYHVSARAAKTGSRSRSAEQPAKGGDDGGLRLPYGRNTLIVLPAAVPIFVQAYELLGLGHLGARD